MTAFARRIPSRELVAIVTMLFGWLMWNGCAERASEPAAKPKPSVSFKPQEMADALHAVIAADREVYARQIMQRLQDLKVAQALENWEQEKGLPLPAHMLRMASESIQRQGAEFHYVLRSLWPINPRNAAETATERTGLEFVASHPDQSFYSEESLGGRRYFTAVYADKAIVPACVDCHNQHPKSSKKDFKSGDVMGGMVVRVPLEF